MRLFGARARSAWYRLVSIGVSPVRTVEARAVMGANHYFALSGICSVPWAFVMVTHANDQVRPAGIAHGVMIGVWAVGLLLNKLRLYTPAAVTGLVAPVVQLTYLSLLFSRDAGFHLPLLAMAGVAFVVLVPRLWWWRYAFTGLATAVVVWVHVDDRFATPAAGISEAWLRSAVVANILLTMVMVFVIAWFNSFYFVRERRRNDRLLGEAHIAAQTDSLTKVLNRRGITPVLSRVTREGDFAVALGDLDRFKRINDRLGHGAGDVVLSNVSRTLVDSIGPRGRVARWGGEEFLIVLPNVNLERAMEIMERARREIEAEYAAEGALEPVTISVGVAHALQYSGKEDVLRVADAKLYEAKASGRNIVMGAAVSNSSHR